jgi:hypothetical protein
MEPFVNYYDIAKEKTLGMILSAFNKEKAEEPRWDYVYKYNVCPACGEKLEDKYNHCISCGQSIKWNNNENNLSSNEFVINLIINTINKSISNKPKETGGTQLLCPCCGHLLNYDLKGIEYFCDCCGQAIDWRGVNYG